MGLKRNPSGGVVPANPRMRRLATKPDRGGSSRSSLSRLRRRSVGSSAIFQVAKPDQVIGQ